MSELRVSLVQADLHWEDPEANRSMFDVLIRDVEADLIVLPEMFNTGFTMSPEHCAEPEESSPTLEWMKHAAQVKSAVVTGSIATRCREGYVNRLYWVTPEGDVIWYDKRHLFRMGEEGEHYTAGTKPVTVSLKGVRISLSICYDLRFPVWLRNYDNAYDVLLCVASWPAPRRNAWRTLLKARAIENQCYVIGVNRCGTDGNGLNYSGDSLLVDYLGESQEDETIINTPQVITGSIDIDALNKFREKFPAWKDADPFVLS